MKEKKLLSSQSVKAKYELYSKIVDGVKFINKSGIDLQPKKNHIGFLTGHVFLEHESLDEPIFVVVDTSQNYSSRFEFKVFAKSVLENPCFRFESDGHCHYNDLDDVPLPERKIPTPHFHRYHESGKEIAFKTEPLKKTEEENILLGDKDFAFAHFCHAGKIQPRIGQSYPSILDQDLFGSLDTVYDPLEGVKFPCTQI